MTSPRPGAVTAAAVLAIIYGSLCTLGGLCGVAGLAAQGAVGQNFMAGGDPNQAKFQKDLQDALQREVPGYQAYLVAGSILGLAVSLALLIGGIGLLGMNSWARTLVLLGCLIAMAYRAFQVVYESAFVVPATVKALQGAPAAALAKDKQAAEFMIRMQPLFPLLAVAMVIVYVLILVYLLILVLLLCRSHVRAAFAGTAPAGLEEGGEQDRRPADEGDQGWGESRPPEDDWRYR